MVGYDKHGVKFIWKICNKKLQKINSLHIVTMQAIIFGGFFLHIFLENIYYCGENKWVMSQVISPMYVNTTYTFFLITPNTKQQSLPEMHFVKLHLFFVHYKETILCWTLLPKNTWYLSVIIIIIPKKFALNLMLEKIDLTYIIESKFV